MVGVQLVAARARGPRGRARPPRRRCRGRCRCGWRRGRCGCRPPSPAASTRCSGRRSRSCARRRAGSAGPRGTTGPRRRSPRPGSADSFITCRALLLKRPMVLMCSISPASPRASIVCGRVGDLEERLGGAVDAAVGRLRRERHGDEEGIGAGMRELAPGLGLGGMEPAENLGDRRVVELLGHGLAWHAARAAPQGVSAGFGWVLRVRRYLPGNSNDEDRP